MKKNLLLFSLIPLIISCNSKIENNEIKLPYYISPDLGPHWFKPGSDSIARAHQIAHFNFKNQNGLSITEKSLDGKITLANFFFTTCGSICPKMTYNLRFIQDTFKNDAQVQFFSFSVKPWEDSVSVLKNYEKSNKLIPDKWQLLTGSKSEIYTLGRRSFFAEKDAGYNLDSTDFLHTEQILLVDKNRHIRGVYNGTDFGEMARIAADIRLLIKE